MSCAVGIRDFSYRYPDGTAALCGVNLSIQKADRVVLVGPNGSGKSTLLLAIGGFVAGSGTVLLNGIKVEKANIVKIRGILGCCMEDPDDQLFMPTLYEDVAFGPLNMGLDSRQIDSRVKESLDQVGLAGMEKKSPHHLSAGQKRAAAIATVLAMSPEIITLDEPDSSLDPLHRRMLIELLSGLPQTLIVATCNIRFAAAIGKRAILLDNGKIAADGPASEILRNKELMESHGLETP